MLVVASCLVSTVATAADLPRLNPSAAGFDPARLAAIDGLVEELIVAEKMPGCVVCIGRRAGIVLLKAYGRRAVKPAPEAMTVDTVFDLASITKPVATATAIMRLVEEGKLRLSDPIATHIPEFAANGKEKLTVHDLLTHQSGLIADNAIEDYADGPAKAVERIWNLTPLHPAATKFIYSDVNFIVLGQLVERISGESVAAFAERATFEPLGMTETGYQPAEPLRTRAAPTEEREGRWMRGEVHDPRAWKLGGVAGHAGLFGTATDLARYATMMLRGGELEGVRVLAPETIAVMTRGWPIPGGGFRGLGWDKRSPLSSNRGDLLTESAFGHGGFTGTALWIDPALDLYVIFLSNRVHPDGKGLVNPLIARIASAAAGAIAESRGVPQAATDRPVLTGIDVLVRDNFRQLAGKKVALITNHTGLDRQHRRTGSLLAKADGVTLVAIFGPEHGASGTFDQANVPDGTDEETGVPVKSLYGKTKRPTAEMLADVDTIVFDIQDIGCRFYTYVSTMLEAMKAAAEHKKAFVVLDRPNPIDGTSIAGPRVDDGRGRPGVGKPVAQHAKPDRGVSLSGHRPARVHESLRGPRHRHAVRGDRRPMARRPCARRRPRRPQDPGRGLRADPVHARRQQVQGRVVQWREHRGHRPGRARSGPRGSRDRGRSPAAVSAGVGDRQTRPAPAPQGDARGAPLGCGCRHGARAVPRRPQGVRPPPAAAPALPIALSISVEAQRRKAWGDSRTSVIAHRRTRGEIIY